MPEETDDKPKRKSMIAIRIVSRTRESTLVEFTDKGKLQRVYVPLDAVGEGGKVDADVLHEGIPYGVQWEEAEFPKVTPDTVAQALREAGIWTTDDLFQKMPVVRNVLTKIHGPMSAVLVKLANERR